MENINYIEKAKDINFRKNALIKLKDTVKKYENDIITAVKKDLNKSEFEGFLCEIAGFYLEIGHVIKNIKKWNKPEKVKGTIVNFPSKNYIYKEPYGKVLIMSPWNYPFQLAFSPLVGAIAAGNTVVLKPSEYSFNTSEVMEKIIKEVFPPEYVKVVRGGREANSDLLNKKFDYIFFTGSAKVGKVVMKAASENLTPVTLELGGKSPCIVDETAKISLAAKRIMWGKLLNCGQTCIAPDYIMVHKSVKEQLINEMIRWSEEFFGKLPLENTEYPKIINEKHFKRILGLIDGEKIIYGGQSDEKSNKIAPTFLDMDNMDSAVMQEEIFGPVFPIISYENIDEVYKYVLSRPKPLALYVFSENKSMVEKTLNTLNFGGCSVNDTISHIVNAKLPFGGVGESGMGQYHGKLTFDTFTHRKSVLKKSTKLDIKLRYAPYGDKIKTIKKFI